MVALDDPQVPKRADDEGLVFRVEALGFTGLLYWGLLYRNNGKENGNYYRLI